MTQVVPVHESVLTTPGRDSSAKYDLVFKAELPALGYKSFYYQKKLATGDEATDNVQYESVCILKILNLRLVYEVN